MALHCLLCIFLPAQINFKYFPQPSKAIKKLKYHLLWPSCLYIGKQKISKEEDSEHFHMIIKAGSTWGWWSKKCDQLQEETSDSYFSNSIKRSWRKTRRKIWARLNNAGDRWGLFAILLTLAHKKGARLNRLWFQSLGRRQPWIEICNNFVANF